MSSPWARAAAPSVTLPPAPASPPTPPSTAPRAAAPFPSGVPQGLKPHRQVWPWITLGLLLAVVISAATGSIVTFAAMHNGTGSSQQSSSAVPTPTPAAPQYSAADMATAKQNLCHIVDLSTGQKIEGGFRVEGNLNVPVTLKALNSASAVQNALVPAVPADVAAAARKYISTTLDVTTAAMGPVPATEINRLTDVSNEAMYALVDACGLPR